MWDWHDSSYEDAEDTEGLAHHRRIVHEPLQPSYDYGVDGKSFF